jgi:hypothetical protein
VQYSSPLAVLDEEVALNERALVLPEVVVGEPLEKDRRRASRVGLA